MEVPSQSRGFVMLIQLLYHSLGAVVDNISPMVHQTVAMVMPIHCEGCNTGFTHTLLGYSYLISGIQQNTNGLVSVSRNF